jgi:AraC family transcriptional regulator of adaptative response / DNA-3-methyladenine glycosylase II
VRAFAGAVAEGRVHLDGRADLAAFTASMEAVPGLGPWTAGYLALRMGEPDAFPVTDLGLRRAYSRLTGPDVPPLPVAAEAWAPWRALAAFALWTAPT